MREFYPVMLRLNGRICVIVGGGRVGARKAVTLLDAGAVVHVISPILHPALQDLADRGMVTAHLMPFAPGILSKLQPALVFAATDSPETNQQVADEARALGVWVDLADSSADSDFLSMSMFQRGSVVVAVSSGGVSSALTVHIREQLEKAVGDEYTTLAGWLAEYKPYIRQKIDSQIRRSHLWQTIVESSVLDDLRRGDIVGARALFERMIAQATKDS
jgi:precorrin-2 dehydrogenase/sirohydrochlorin ferrochelatase